MPQFLNYINLNRYCSTFSDENRGYFSKQGFLFLRYTRSKFLFSSGFCKSLNIVANKLIHFLVAFRLSRFLKLLLLSSWWTSRRQLEMPVNISRSVFEYAFIVGVVSPPPPSFLNCNLWPKSSSWMLQFYKNFSSNLEDIMWKPPHEKSKLRNSKTNCKE